MNKKAIAILGGIFILIVGALGFLLYQRSHKASTAVAPTNQQTQEPSNIVDNSSPVNTPPDNSAPSNTPATGAQAAIKLTDDEVISPILFYQGTGISYFNSQGQLFQTDISPADTGILLSNKRELTIALKTNISKILWPQTSNNFIAQFGSGGPGTTWSFYDSNTGSYADYPSQVTSLDWMPTADKVMFVWMDASGKSTLYSSNPDGSSYTAVTPMYEADDQISVAPNGKSILFWRTQNTGATNIISLISSDAKFYKAVVPDGYNLGVKWSPDSSQFLFGRRDSATQTFQLWQADVTAGTIKNLGVNTTPDKCVWTKDSRTIYCGVGTDTLSRIAVTTGIKTDFAPGIAVDAQDLFLSSDEHALFFKNNQDRALYYIDVSK